MGLLTTVLNDSENKPRRKSKTQDELKEKSYIINKSRRVFWTRLVFFCNVNRR